MTAPLTDKLPDAGTPETPTGNLLNAPPVLLPPAPAPVLPGDHTVEFIPTSFDGEDMRSFEIGNVIVLAEGKHKRQKRRNGSPYINHLHNVANDAHQIAIAMGFGPHAVLVVTAAGYLHDTLEDTSTDFDDLVAVSNRQVAALVSWVSDDKRLPREHRDLVYSDRLRQAPPLAHILKLADLTDNLTGAEELLHDLDDKVTSARKLSTVRFVQRWSVKAKRNLAAITYAHGVAGTRNLAKRLDDMAATAARLEASVQSPHGSIR